MRIRQLYLPDTNILFTRFLAEEGVAELTDFKPIEKDTGQPNEIVRIRRSSRTLFRGTWFQWTTPRELSTSVHASRADQRPTWTGHSQEAARQSGNGFPANHFATATSPVTSLPGRVQRLALPGSGDERKCRLTVIASKSSHPYYDVLDKRHTLACPAGFSHCAKSSASRSSRSPTSRTRVFQLRLFAQHQFGIRFASGCARVC